MQRTFASERKMRFEGIPLCGICFIVGRKEQPGVEPRKVLDGSINLGQSINHRAIPDELAAYLISANGGRKDLETLGHNWV
jgi:hypothetical protein